MRDFGEFWKFSSQKDVSDEVDLTEEAGRTDALVFRPDDFGPSSPESNHFVGIPMKFEDKKFVRISLSRTRVSNVTFRNCTFDRCHLIGTYFINCEFHACDFVNTNIFKIRFKDCYISPTSFGNCLDSSSHQNLGVHLYNELFRNSRAEGQEAFALESDTSFRRWKRYLNQIEFTRMSKKTKVRFFRRLQHQIAQAVDVFWDISSNYGNSLNRLLLSGFIATLFFASLNFIFRSEFGLSSGPVTASEMVKIYYFTVISMTTVGYGEIHPTTTEGQAVAVLQSVVGFILFAFIASTIFKRGSR